MFFQQWIRSSPWLKQFKGTLISYCCVYYYIEWNYWYNCYPFVETYNFVVIIIYICWKCLNILHIFLQLNLETSKSPGLAKITRGILKSTHPKEDFFIISLFNIICSKKRKYMCAVTLHHSRWRAYFYCCNINIELFLNKRNIWLKIASKLTCSHDWYRSIVIFRNHVLFIYRY